MVEILSQIHFSLVMAVPPNDRAYIVHVWLHSALTDMYGDLEEESEDARCGIVDLERKLSIMTRAKVDTLVFASKCGAMLAF